MEGYRRAQNSRNESCRSWARNNLSQEAISTKQKSKMHKGRISMKYTLDTQMFKGGRSCILGLTEGYRMHKNAYWRVTECYRIQKNDFWKVTKGYKIHRNAFWKVTKALIYRGYYCRLHFMFSMFSVVKS